MKHFTVAGIVLVVVFAVRFVAAAIFETNGYDAEPLYKCAFTFMTCLWAYRVVDGWESKNGNN